MKLEVIQKRIISGAVVALFLIVLCIASSYVNRSSIESVYDESKVSAEMKTQLDTYVSEASAAYHVPGASVVVVNKSRTLYGANTGEAKGFDQNFLLGSESKSFTGLAVMKLVEEGKIDLNASIKTYLSDTNYEPDIKVIDLLHHTSGFTAYQRPKDREVTDSQGSFSYSDSNYDLLGEIIENVSGQPFANYIQDNILKPLEMYNTSADLANYKSLDFVKGYQNLFGFAFPADICYPTKESWSYVPSGYITSTSNDMAKYLQMYLRGGMNQRGKRIYSNEIIENVWNNTTPVSANQSYGMGWFRTDLGGKVVYYHVGMTEDYYVAMLVSPSDNIAISVMTDSYDYFVGSKNVSKMPFDILNIMLGNEVSSPSSFAFSMKHVLINIIYLIALLGAMVLLYLAIISKGSEFTPTVYALIAIGAIMPIILLLAPTAIAGGMWFFMSFIRDAWLVIVAASALYIIGVVFRVVKMIMWKLKQNNQDE